MKCRHGILEKLDQVVAEEAHFMIKTPSASYSSKFQPRLYPTKDARIWVVILQMPKN